MLNNKTLRPFLLKLRVWVLFLFTLVLFSCATTGNFDRSYGSWLGAPIQQLVDAWGQPTKEIPLQSGNSEYAYNLFHESSTTKGCVVYFEVDKESKKIVRLRHFNYKEERPCRKAPSCV